MDEASSAGHVWARDNKSFFDTSHRAPEIERWELRIRTSFPVSLVVLSPTPVRTRPNLFRSLSAARPFSWNERIINRIVPTMLWIRRYWRPVPRTRGSIGRAECPETAGHKYAALAKLRHSTTLTEYVDVDDRMHGHWHPAAVGSWCRTQAPVCPPAATGDRPDNADGRWPDHGTRCSTAHHDFFVCVRTVASEMLDGREWKSGDLM